MKGVVTDEKYTVRIKICVKRWTFRLIFRGVCLAERKIMNNFEIVEYDEQWAQKAEVQFERYVRDDLKMELTSEAIREKIWRVIFVGGWEKGTLSIALAAANGEVIGMAIYQIDSRRSDWCERKGWGCIREFFIRPDYRGMGYGRRLADYAERRLRNNAERLYLTADDALEFWRACGYEKIDGSNENGTYTMTK